MERLLCSPLHPRGVRRRTIPVVMPRTGQPGSSPSPAAPTRSPSMPPVRTTPSSGYVSRLVGRRHKIALEAHTLQEGSTPVATRKELRYVAVTDSKGRYVPQASIRRISSSTKTRGIGWIQRMWGSPHSASREANRVALSNRMTLCSFKASLTATSASIRHRGP